MYGSKPSVTKLCCELAYLQSKESLSVCLWFTYLENRSSKLLHTWQACSWGPNEVQCKIWYNLDMQHIHYEYFSNKQRTPLCAAAGCGFSSLNTEAGLQQIPFKWFHLEADVNKMEIGALQWLAVATTGWMRGETWSLWGFLFFSENWLWDLNFLLTAVCLLMLAARGTIQNGD